MLVIQILIGCNVSVAFKLSLKQLTYPEEALINRVSDVIEPGKEPVNYPISERLGW